MLNPADESPDVGVDTWLVLLAAAVAPAHHSNNVVSPVPLAHQRPARVTLQGQRKSFTACDGQRMIRSITH